MRRGGNRGEEVRLSRIRLRLGQPPLRSYMPFFLLRKLESQSHSPVEESTDSELPFTQAELLSPGTEGTKQAADFGGLHQTPVAGMRGGQGDFKITALDWPSSDCPCGALCPQWGKGTRSGSSAAERPNLLGYKIRQINTSRRAMRRGNGLGPSFPDFRVSIYSGLASLAQHSPGSLRELGTYLGKVP